MFIDEIIFGKYESSQFSNNGSIGILYLSFIFKTKSHIFKWEMSQKKNQ